MSERLLVSPSPFLAALSNEMRYRLGYNSKLALKEENVEKYYTNFLLLFTGDYTFETHLDLLNTCVKQFLQCVMIFVLDHVDLDNRGINNVKKWIAIIDNLAGIASIRNKFLFFEPILQDSLLQQCRIWFNREFLLHLNRLFEIDTKLIFTTDRHIQFLLRTVKKWMKTIMECGDYEYQVVLVEIIINTCEKHHLDEIFEHLDDLAFLKIMFLKVHSRIDYVNDLEALLRTINSNKNNTLNPVRSLPCLNVTLEDRVIPPLKGGAYTCMHINYGVDTLSFNCDRNSLTSLQRSQSFSNFDEFVTVNYKDINEIRLNEINDDCEGVNTVGGIFSINISGQCSCRFDSSKEMVYSIKNISLEVSEGAYVDFLKNEFWSFIVEKKYSRLVWLHNLEFDKSLTSEENNAILEYYFENNSEETITSQTHPSLKEKELTLNSEESVNISVTIISKVNENDDSESNAKPERDFDNISIISISSTEESDSDVEFPDNPIEEQASESYSCDPAMIISENNEVYDEIRNSETPEINLNEGVIQKNDNLIINDCNSDLVEAKSNSENVNKEASSIDMDLSAQTVKIDKWHFPKNIPDDLISEIITSESNAKPERDFDNISIISISSTEESDSDVEFLDNPIEEQASESYSCDPAMIISENNEVYDGICNSETPEMNFNKGVIRKNCNLIINDCNSDLVEAKSNSENVNNDIQLLNDKYVAAVNELQKIKNELARAHADIARRKKLKHRNEKLKCKNARSKSKNKK